MITTSFAATMLASGPLASLPAQDDLQRALGEIAELRAQNRAITERNDALAKIQEKYKAEAAHIMLHEIIDLTAVQRNVKNFKNRVRTFNYEDIEFAN